MGVARDDAATRSRQASLPTQPSSLNSFRPPCSVSKPYINIDKQIDRHIYIYTHICCIHTFCFRNFIQQRQPPRSSSDDVLQPPKQPATTLLASTFCLPRLKGQPKEVAFQKLQQGESLTSNRESARLGAPLKGSLESPCGLSVLGSPEARKPQPCLEAPKPEILNAFVGRSPLCRFALQAWEPPQVPRLRDGVLGGSELRRSRARANRTESLGIA